MDRIVARLSGSLPRWCLAGLALFGFALASRFAFFGDIAYFNDESFYLLAGQKMHAGALPYVDVWDRKGPVVFALWYLLAALPWQPIGYQIVAWLFAWATAMIIARITAVHAGMQGAVFAGAVYLASLPMFGGGSGQTPVFYNLAMALCGWWVFSARGELAAGRVPRRVIGAMVAAGLAIACKQSAAAEGMMFGLYVLVCLHGSNIGLRPVLRAGLRLAMAGAAPLAVAGLVYAAIGHWQEFWQAMVTANLIRPANPYGDHWLRMRALAIAASPLLVLAGIGMALPRQEGELPGVRQFLVAWTAAAAIGVVMLPNFYDHYMLPLMVPLALAGGRAAGRGLWGALAAVAVASIFLIASSALERAPRDAASAELRDVAARIVQRRRGALLLVYEGPMALYGRAGRPPESPLLDNFHLFYPYENNTSHLDTAAEMTRILGQRPDVVVTAEPFSAIAANRRTAEQVWAYLAGCSKWFTGRHVEHVSVTPFAVWGDCRENRVKGDHGQ